MPAQFVVEDVRNLHKTLARMNFSNLIGVLAAEIQGLKRGTQRFFERRGIKCVFFWMLTAGIMSLLGGAIVLDGYSADHKSFPQKMGILI